jgi:hypothetical protein
MQVHMHRKILTSLHPLHDIDISNTTHIYAISHIGITNSGFFLLLVLSAGLLG